MFEYDYRTSVIRNPTGEVVFEMNNVEVPKHWSQIATDILAQKYFRKAGVPQPDGSLGREMSSKQVAHRMAHCWRVWGERYGYFETEKDHLNALSAFNKSLKRSGILVLDYFNSEKIVQNLAHQEVKQVDGIEFYITKKVANGNIIKSISFEHKSKNFSFKEEVKAFSKSDFERMFEKSGFKVLEHFGDYALNPFNEIKSDRLIFICQKADA
jgi:hypothetical protein